MCLKKNLWASVPVHVCSCQMQSASTGFVVRPVVHEHISLNSVCLSSEIASLALVWQLEHSCSSRSSFVSSDCHCRVIIRADTPDKDLCLKFNNKPTAAALAILSTFSPYSGSMLDSFLEAGGAHAAVQVLRHSSCQTALWGCASLIGGLLAHTGCMPKPASSGKVDRVKELADEFCRSGE
jgi:hypothetical protein